MVEEEEEEEEEEEKEWLTSCATEALSKARMFNICVKSTSDPAVQ